MSKRIIAKAAYRNTRDAITRKKHSTHCRAMAANTIRIFQTIGVDEGEYSASQFRRELSAIESEKIAVEINSEGGQIIEGLAIYDAIKSHPAHITTRCLGGAFSIASIVFLAGDVREISEHGHIMIHFSASDICGTSGDLRERANLLDKFNDRMLDIYSSVMRFPRQRIKSMMAAETFFDASEAISSGLANKQIESFALAASLSRARAKKRKRSAVPTLTAQQRWDSAIDKHVATGSTRFNAIKKIVRGNPRLHQQLIAEANLAKRSS